MVVKRYKFVLMEFKYVNERQTLTKSWNEERAMRRKEHEPIEQRSANYGPLPVFVNKVLLKHSHVHHLHIVYGCFHATTAELSNCK